MTRKEFVLNVVEQMKENPRAVLAGHGIPSAVLQTIVERPDVMSKLAVVLYSMNSAKKGAKGLVKAPNFRIFGYKNFAGLNTQAREDIEGFIAGLPGEDSANFSNADNIMTILMLPADKTVGETDLETEIVSGKSVAMSFDIAVRKEYRLGNGMYVVVMMGDSAIRPAEEKIAQRKEKANAKVQIRRTPAKIAAELKAKAKKRLEKLNSKRAELQQQAFRLQKQRQQFGQLGKIAGSGTNNLTNIKGALNKIDAMSSNVKAIIASLTPEEKSLFNLARRYMKAGDKINANRKLRQLNKPEITAWLQGGAVKGSNTIVDGRKNELKAEITRLTGRSEELMLRLSAETDNNKKLSLRSMISKNTAKVRELRAKLGTYKDISVKGMKNKAAMLKQVNDAIQANLAAGAQISQALNSALAGLNAKPAEKQLIKQQVIQEVASGAPMQFAVQQAIQDNIQQAPVSAAGLQDTTFASAGITDIDDLLNSII